MIDVAIVGGGPVGLYLAALLLQDGVGVRIYEQRHARSVHSRAIGIHPPALAALHLVGCAETLVRQGVPIESGLAFSNGRRLGSIDFSALPARYPFVLSSPQAVTEAVLEERVSALDGGALRRGVKVAACTVQGSQVEVALTCSDDAGGQESAAELQQERVQARWLVMAGGASSPLPPGGPAGQRNVRRRAYRDAYVMGDFADSTGFGSAAALFLERRGIVESFPLPGHIRRWVARVGNHDPNRTADWLAGVVHARTGTSPDAASCSMLSSFRVRSSMLPRLLHPPTAVIGDAAHELSPIGGQGMNLGWLDAAALAPIIMAGLTGPVTGDVVSSFDRSRRRAARRAAFQSEINMVLGRPGPAPLLALRDGLIGGLAGIPAVNRYLAHRFTMQ